MIRKTAILGIPRWHKSLPFLDGLLWIMAAARGRIFFLNRSMAAYRVGNGVSQQIEYTTGRDYQVYALAKCASMFPKNAQTDIDTIVTEYWRWRSHVCASNQRRRSANYLLQLIAFRLRLGRFAWQDAKRLVRVFLSRGTIQRDRTQSETRDA